MFCILPLLVGGESFPKTLHAINMQSLFTDLVLLNALDSQGDVERALPGAVILKLYDQLSIIVHMLYYILALLVRLWF